MSIGFQEILFVLLIILVLFGSKRLTEIAKSFGKAIKEFKNSMKEIKNDLDEKK